jgi:hypothetical protein
VQTAISTGLTSIQGDALATLAAALPFALEIFGFIFVAKKAIKFFRTTTNA